MNNGVRYLIHQIGTPKIGMGKNGGIAPAGLWWNPQLEQWGDRHSADLYPSDAPDTLNLPDGGEWVAVFVAVSAGFVS